MENNKRRRTTSMTTHISDLPVGFLVDVSAYLSKPSRALFAVAMSAPSSSWQKLNHGEGQPSRISEAIILHTQWDTIDFEDVELELAVKLRDVDIYALLTCINAKQTLKTQRVRTIAGLVH